jgi:hypothetical protein
MLEILSGWHCTTDPLIMQRFSSRFLASAALSGSAYVSRWRHVADRVRTGFKDSNGQPLKFNIVGKPSRASFNNATGQLTGTPTAAQAGTYSSITISVTAPSGRTLVEFPLAAASFRVVTVPVSGGDKHTCSIKLPPAGRAP